MSNINQIIELDQFGILVNVSIFSYKITFIWHFLLVVNLLRS
jgi:hypothetical protein